MPVDPSNNISGFVNAFAGGGVRTNLFVVNGTIPGYSDNRAISFLCKAAQIPASSLGTIEVPYRGRRIKLPGDRTFQDWSLTIISDANMALRSAFAKSALVSNTWALRKLKRAKQLSQTCTKPICPTAAAA